MITSEVSQFWRPILSVALPIFIVVLILVLVILLAKRMYRIADVDKVLIVNGGKKPKYITSGGAFIIPIIRKADTFDLCMLTVKAPADEIMTSTAVPVLVDWTAQIRPNRSDMSKLETCIISFKERGKQGIIDDVKLTLMGAVRDVVASMTPEQVLADKEKFKQLIQESVTDELDRMGLELVSLNIQDITDNNGYFKSIAYLDHAEKEKAEEIKHADTDRITREKRAEASLAAEKAESESQKQADIARMEAEQERNEKRKETDLKIAANKVETDTAQANAEIAKELQSTKRAKEVEEYKGAVEIMKQEQANLAAQKEREVMITKAEAQKQTAKINAQATADVKSIEADNAIAIAERRANALRQEATGEADVEKTKADARVLVAQKDAEAIRAKADAEAARIRAEGSAAADVSQAHLVAEAEGIKAKGLAEAESIKAKKLAEAEGERALAEALAANEKVNFEIEKLRISAEAQVKVATATATIMANIGQNAEFVNIGGNNIPGVDGFKTGNALLDTLTSIPVLMKTLNAENQALNGKNITDEIAAISDATLSGLKNLKNANGETGAVSETK